MLRPGKAALPGASPSPILTPVTRTFPTTVAGPLLATARLNQTAWTTSESITYRTDARLHELSSRLIFVA